MKAHVVAASATQCLQKVRRKLLVKLAIICFLSMALYGVAFKYIDMTITHKFQPLNMHGYDTEHGKVERYKVLTTGESSERVEVLMNVTRNGNAFTNKSMSGLQYVNRSIAVPDSIPNSFNTIIVETNIADQNESNTYVNNLTVQSEITLSSFNKTFDVADSLANRFNTGIVKNTQSPQNETQTDANVIPTDQSVPKAERLVRMPMADISQTGNKLTDMVNTTQAPQNDRQTDAIPQVIPDRSVPKAERLVSMRMSDISQLASKLPGVLTNLQPLGPGIKESPEFPGMPDPCAGPTRMTGVEDILCMKPPTFLPDYKNPCWHDDNTFRCLPYFHLIGMCKSATSDLFKRLHMHPDIIPNRGIFGKEIWYWSWRRFETTGKFGKFKMGMTLKEFTNHFFTTKLQTTDTNGKHKKITGNGDPMDVWDRFRESNLPQNTPGADELLWTTPYAVRHVNPNVKLLLMLRDPVDRLYSHYFHGRYGKSAHSFHDHVVISIERWKACTSSHSIRHCIYDQPFSKTLPAPIFTSFYIVHLLEWLKAFPREQILIFRNEDYTVDIKGTMTDIFRFLDVEVPNDHVLTQMANMAPFFESIKRKSAGPMLPETKRLLVELYRPYNEQLAAFLGDERFAWRDASFATA